jgi:prolyl oligopeptidase
MLRSETTQNGQYNTTEYGSVKAPENFKALYAYSPYHHVRDGVKYPSILFLVGENDPRVDPWHSRKFAAALQAATASKDPILLISFATPGTAVSVPLKTSASQCAPTCGSSCTTSLE